MGDRPTEPLRPQFDRCLRLRFVGAQVTSDAGLLAYRELDDALDLTRTAAGELQDSRTGQNTRHTADALLRQSIYTAWPATRTSTTPNASASTPPCAPWSAGAPGIPSPPRPARWLASRLRR